MAAVPEIEWTDATWNPVRGCTKISPGCKFCYAEVFAERFRGVPGHPYEQGFDLRLVPEHLADPLVWTKPKCIFVNSGGDPPATADVLGRLSIRRRAWWPGHARGMACLRLPAKVKDKEAKATFRDGVLTIRAPLAEDAKTAKPHKLPIEASLNRTPGGRPAPALDSGGSCFRMRSPAGSGAACSAHR